MSNIEAAKQLYNTCKNMDIDETMQLVLSADNAEEQEFFSGHPEAGFPWSNTVTYTLYAVYLLAAVVLLLAPFKRA